MGTVDGLPEAAIAAPFIELAAPQLQRATSAGLCHCTLELENTDGMKMRIQLQIAAMPDLAAIIIIHTAGSVLLPITSCCDIIYDGEIMGWQDLVPPEGDYFQTFRNDLFQMVFSCKNYGPVCCFHDMTMTYLGKEGMGKICSMHNQRMLWATWLTHDVQACSGFTCGSENLLYFWLDHFDIADPKVEFHSYWQPTPPVKVLRGCWPHGDDKASKTWAVAYSKPGAVLVAVVRDAPNNYGGPVTIDVQLDRKRLGLPVGALKSLDLETLSRTEKGIVEGNILKIPVEADDFSAVVIRAP